MPDHTVLCKKPRVTASRLRHWLDTGEKSAIADFIENRFRERYLNPLDCIGPANENGFATMALCCLTVEALQGFKGGIPSTERNSGKRFDEFLTEEPRFAAFRTVSKEFFKNVRCGLLHRGETDGGWKIWLVGRLFTPSTLTINAKLFQKEIHAALTDYANELRASDYNAPIWRKACKKLDNILKNCERQ